MRSIRCIIACGALSLLGIAGVSAQDFDPPRTMMIDDSVGHVLNLTNEQMKQVQVADEHYSDNRKAGDKEALAKWERDIKAALLPTQYEEWKAMTSKRKENR
jgi:hypothetical protein